MAAEHLSCGQIFAHGNKLTTGNSVYLTGGRVVTHDDDGGDPGEAATRKEEQNLSLFRRKWSDGRNSGRFLFCSSALSKFPECFQPFSRIVLGGLLTSLPNKVQGRSGGRSPVSQPPAALACVLLGPVTSLGNQRILFTGRRLSTPTSG